MTATEHRPYDPVDKDEPTGWMKTVSGHYVNILAPTMHDIRLDDIAHALSRICRFGGHTKTVYCVGEHSIGVADMLWRTYRDEYLSLQGLLHDASEAYLGDVIRPLKNLMPQYKEAEERFERVISERFDLPYPMDPRVKECDSNILAWEMALFRDAEYRKPSDPETVAEYFIGRAWDYGNLV